MEAKNVKITIISGNSSKTMEVRAGLGFQAVCTSHKTPIEFDCRKADCGICAFKVVAGGENLSPPTVAEADFLKAMKADKDERLACQVRIFGDVKIRLGYL